MGEFREPERIYIRDLTCRCIVGINAEERTNRQDVIVNVVIEADLRAACTSDRISDTIDYKAMKIAILNAVEQSQYFLVERLAERVADICLADPRVLSARVTIDKPGALRFARSVAIEVNRHRGGGRA
jgi:dihydroneopterin aldolase/D-erythro-7,8-dihydroneopterin triphosphate epimerase